MHEGRGHSLWLMPRGEAGACFAEIIGELSERYGTPCFPPHVTLLARVSQLRPEVVALTRELVREFSAFSIDLGKPAFTNEYFRSLFIRVEPNDALRSAHRLARKLFGVSEPHFSPHLSLLYGDLPDAEKDDIVARLDYGFHTRFTAEAIEVYLTQGAPEAWRLVESVPLG